jgi:hypothetical protein
VDSLKALDPNRPIREADISWTYSPTGIRYIFKGLADSYLYRSGRIDTLPFDELRRRSLINQGALVADGAPDFSQRIRASLPTISR